MKSILKYIQDFYEEIDKWSLACITLFTAVFVFINYYTKLDHWIAQRGSFGSRLFFRYLVSASAFVIPYIIIASRTKSSWFNQPVFVALVLLAPIIFSLKMEFRWNFNFSNDATDNRYWNRVVYWPMLLVITSTLVFICWKLFDQSPSLYGLTTKNIDWKPYWMMLLFMVPLIAFASTQADFLHTYPKLKSVTGAGINEFPVWKKVLFELSYGSDFFSIELFFRGFLVLAFVKWAGPSAIIPMACFYCTIHFGKPLAECISSYFGGLLLGIVVYRTQSIFGGLMVHLGIAWLMEIGGYIGGSLKPKI